MAETSPASASTSTLDAELSSSLPDINGLIRSSVKRTHCLFSAEDAFRYNDASDKACVITVLRHLHAHWADSFFPRAVWNGQIQA